MNPRTKSSRIIRISLPHALFRRTSHFNKRKFIALATSSLIVKKWFSSTDFTNSVFKLKFLVMKINVITLGVKDLQKSNQFYQGLFDTFPAAPTDDNIVFFSIQGLVISLYPIDKLADDACLNQKKSVGDFSGMTLACLVRDKNEVSQIIKKAQRLGATILKPAQDVFWGGHSGYFADLDGHVWEIAWNPFFPMDQQGNIHLEKAM